MSDNQTFEYNISQVDSITFAGDETKEIGIVIYGTENPMNTSFDIPADIQSNILVAYYGYPNEAGKYDEVEFPTYEDGIGHVNYIRTDEVLTRMDWEMISLTGVEGQIEQKARVPIYNVEGYGGGYAYAERFTLVSPPAT